MPNGFNIPYLLDCKPRLIMFLFSFRAACNRGRLTFFP